MKSAASVNSADSGESVNLALHLRRHAEATPEKPAVIHCRSGRIHTFRELEAESDAAARGFAEIGITRGTKTLLMLRPALPFFSAFFALLKVGAVPVFIDPGMGGRRLLECIRNLAPEAMVAVPLAHALRVLRRGHFPGFKTAVTVGPRLFWGGHSWRRMLRPSPEPFPLAPTAPNEMAAILFTTGSTGPAKGVEYSHAALGRQVDILADTFRITPEDRDAATFPGFSLFSIALGMTAVLPDMNPVRPGSVNPEAVLAAANGHGCTFSFGSPALWSRVAGYAAERGIKLPGLSRIVMAGAPVPATTHRLLLEHVLPPEADTFTPYGATECMPVACIGGREVLADTVAETAKGKGVCVGRPAPGVRVEIIRLDDGAIPNWADDLVLPPGEIGEIAVQALHASRHYHNNPEADSRAKIADGDGFWHRMGDAGYKDSLGRIWFCGRAAHRVRARGGDMFTVPCEAIFNRHAGVARSALVGVPADGGFERPVIVIQPAGRAQGSAGLTAELLALAQGTAITARVHDVLYVKSFPTDIRHNAKIRREDLAVLAARRLGISRGRLRRRGV